MAASQISQCVSNVLTVCFHRFRLHKLYMICIKAVNVPLQQRGSALNLDISREHILPINFESVWMNSSDIFTTQNNTNVYYQQQMVSSIFCFPLLSFKYY
jgi:hypothetical protein